MKSGKQRKVEIKAKRVMRDALRPTLQGGQKRKEILSGKAPCNPQNLAAYNSYGDPAFVVRGYYLDVLFQCASCRKQEVWTATQQKWWYEVAKGSVESRAKLCNPCRKVERERKVMARRIHLDGVAARAATRNDR